MMSYDAWINFLEALVIVGAGIAVWWLVHGML